jgi:hypothetical protein
MRLWSSAIFDQPVIEFNYERGGYATRLDYRQPTPPPPLEAEQQAWVEQLLAAYHR